MSRDGTGAPSIRQSKAKKARQLMITYALRGIIFLLLALMIVLMVYQGASGCLWLCWASFSKSELTLLFLCILFTNEKAQQKLDFFDKLTRCPIKGSG